jgi:HPt (histidine-containing phosphotransfer) domain-containing protein
METDLRRSRAAFFYRMLGAGSHYVQPEAEPDRSETWNRRSRLAASAKARARLAPPQLAVAEPAIDRVHLSRMTLGEASLEREVLALFERQTELLLPRIRGAAPAQAATLAHTLKGSALGIGAFSVARAAARVEESGPAALSSAIDALASAIDLTVDEIARLLRTR